MTQSFADQIFQGFTDWVAGGATWVLDQIITLLQATSTVNLDANWFRYNYGIMIALGSWVMLLMLILAGVRGAFAGDAGHGLWLILLYVPIAVAGTFMAIPLVNMVLGVVDDISLPIARSMGTPQSGELHDFIQNISGALGPHLQPVAAPFVIFICSVLMVIFGLLVMVELLFRDGAIYATAVFIPLALSTIVFPGAGRVAKRLAEVVFGLILLKLFIVIVFTLGVSAMGSETAGKPVWNDVLAGMVMLILSAVLPNLLIGLLPLLEGAAVAGIAQRHTVQTVAPSSNGHIYSQIRRSNEQGSYPGAGGFGAGGVPGGGGAGGGAGLIGSRQLDSGGSGFSAPSGGGPLSPKAGSGAGKGGGGSGSSGCVASLSGRGNKALTSSTRRLVPRTPPGGVKNV